MFWTNDCWLFISDPLIVEAMYTTKNKYFDKHPIMKNLMYVLTGDSILLATTSAEWRARRKALSPAFYKGKLVKMVEIARKSVQLSLDVLDSLLKESTEPRRQIDFIDQTSNMNVRIMLMCAFGEDMSQQQIDYWHNGRLEKRSLSFSLRETFHLLVNRLATPHILFFPFLAKWYLTPAERDMKANAIILREFVSEIADRRRETIKKDPTLADSGDFLTILLTDELFKDSNQRIIDECLTFFFAGS